VSHLTLTDRAEVGPLLLTPASHSPDVELFTAAASLTEAAGWMAHDGGSDHVARLHFTRAFRLAAVAECRAVVANVCASLSHLASHLGEPHEAVRLADKGLQQGKQKPVAAQLVARLHAMRALAFAGQEESRACLRALELAERALARDRGQDVGWVSHFDEGSLASETAMCLRRLGDTHQAELHARRAIDLRNGDRVRSRSFAQITLARVLVDAHRVDEAADIGTAVCEAASTLASTRVIHQLDSLGQALGEHESVAEVAEFQEGLAELHRSDQPSPQPTPWPT
jgi:tetratricopeptide (TPR) repeat protein